MRKSSVGSCLGASAPWRAARDGGTGLAFDASTAVLVEYNNDATNGDARVVGSGYAYFLTAPAAPPATDALGRLSYADIVTHRVDAAAPTFKFPALGAVLAGWARGRAGASAGKSGNLSFTSRGA